MVKLFKTSVRVYKSKAEAIRFIDKNYNIQVLNPEALKAKIEKNGICKLPDLSLLIVDEQGLLD